MAPRMIRMTDWLWEALGREAKANGMSKAEFARMAIASVVMLSAARRGAPYIGPAGELLDVTRAVLAAQKEEA